MAEPNDLDRLFAEGTAIDAAFQRAAAAARAEYLRLGRAMPVWQDGRVVWLRPEQIEQVVAEPVSPDLSTRV